jgi:hypothetical protein
MCFKVKANSTQAKLDGVIGRGVKECYLDENGDLIFVMTDGAKLNLGNVKKVMPVHFTKGEDGIWSADRTYEEICLAHESGSYVVAYDGMLFAPLTYLNDRGVMFTSVYPPVFPNENVYEMSVQSYMIGDDNAVAVREERCNFLPAANKTFDEMIMVSHRGVWDMVPMPKAEVSEEQIAEIAEMVKASMTTEEWSFTLEDGTTAVKKVYVE